MTMPLTVGDLLSKLSPSAQEQFKAEAWAEARRQGKARRYVPRGACATLQSHAGAEVLISGPAGTGKSRACLEKLHAVAQRYPGARLLIVRKTRVSLNESALVTFEHNVLGQDHALVAGGPTRPHRSSYRYPNGSEIIIGGMDKASRIMSTEFDMVFIQEATELTLDDWESLSTRVRNGRTPDQQMIADGNPSYPRHWLKARCDAGQTAYLASRHEDNPRLWDTGQGDWTDEGRGYIAKLDALTGARKERLRYGRWSQTEGVVYEAWDEGVHLIDAFPIPGAWRRFCSIDFGFNNPFVCQWWAISPDDVLYLYREVYLSQRLVEDHAVDIKRLSAGERIEATVADHDAEDRATLRRHGITTRAAEKSIREGIEAVQERLRVQANGKARLYIMRGARGDIDSALLDKHKPTSTAEEFTTYIWQPAAEGRTAKEVPVDLDNHGMDAMRYAVMYAARQGGGQFVH